LNYGLGSTTTANSTVRHAQEVESNSFASLPGGKRLVNRHFAAGAVGHYVR
jgi:hypothetical protein